MPGNFSGYIFIFNSKSNKKTAVISSYLWNIHNYSNLFFANSIIFMSIHVDYTVVEQT